VRHGPRLLTERYSATLSRTAGRIAKATIARHLRLKDLQLTGLQMMAEAVAVATMSAGTLSNSPAKNAISLPRRLPGFTGLRN